jgi:hypothetical protein
VVLGDDAKTGTKKALAQSSSIEGFRRADGSQTVFLLDDQGEPIAKVSVTRHMKTVAVGRSCRTMDAH